MYAHHIACHVVLCSRSVVFFAASGLHFWLQWAKFSNCLSMVSNCGNFKEDVDSCSDLGYLIPVIRYFTQSRSCSSYLVISLWSKHYYLCICLPTNDVFVDLSFLTTAMTTRLCHIFPFIAQATTFNIELFAATAIFIPIQVHSPFR